MKNAISYLVKLLNAAIFYCLFCRVKWGRIEISVARFGVENSVTSRLKKSGMSISQSGQQNTY